MGTKVTAKSIMNKRRGVDQKLTKRQMEHIADTLRSGSFSFSIVAEVAKTVGGDRAVDIMGYIKSYDGSNLAAASKDTLDHVAHMIETVTGIRFYWTVDEILAARPIDPNESLWTVERLVIETMLAKPVFEFGVIAHMITPGTEVSYEAKALLGLDNVIQTQFSNEQKLAIVDLIEKTTGRAVHYPGMAPATIKHR